MTNEFAIQTHSLFGRCPKCGRNDGFQNVGDAHWFVCHVHGLCWCVGSNLFPCWRFEDEREWHPNWEGLRPYKQTDPPYRVLTLASPAWMGLRGVIAHHAQPVELQHSDREKRLMRGYLQDVEEWLQPQITDQYTDAVDSGKEPRRVACFDTEDER